MAGECAVERVAGDSGNHMFVHRRTDELQAGTRGVQYGLAFLGVVDVSVLTRGSQVDQVGGDDPDAHGGRRGIERVLVVEVHRLAGVVGNRAEQVVRPRGAQSSPLPRVPGAKTMVGVGPLPCHRPAGSMTVALVATGTPSCVVEV